ncbi:hypothetical protein [Flavobacterium sp.]|jgi:hypothetical protein|uniref:hypothetical protein n=1 Tax=Flavobacterium sp. TaxID=239 RepID=UPI0037BFBA6B
MKNLILSSFGNVIATDEKSSEIYNHIKNLINQGDSIKIDAKNVTISTKSSRLIFGKLYKELTSKVFLEKIFIENASTIFMFSVNEGISTEIQFA